MRLKRKYRKIILIILLLIALCVCIYLFINNNRIIGKKKIQDIFVSDKIEEYGYSLKSNATKEYKKLFNELKNVLKSDSINYEEYSKLISQMFIIDFYTLDNKLTKNDIGGIEFVYSPMLDNFVMKAENTYYKYVDSNIYGDRDQNLPRVNKVSVDSVSNEAYTYSFTRLNNETLEDEKYEGTDEGAYVVNVSWNYVSDIYSDYQNNAVLYFVHDNNKLVLVEIKNE